MRMMLSVGCGGAFLPAGKWAAAQIPYESPYEGLDGVDPRACRGDGEEKRVSGREMTRTMYVRCAGFAATGVAQRACERERCGYAGSPLPPGASDPCHKTLHG